jgi:hypothetical protein
MTANMRPGDRSSVRARNTAQAREVTVFQELLKTFEECREPNWDGYGAEAVREETYHFARQLLAVLPPVRPVPSIGAEPWNGIDHHNELCP